MTHPAARRRREHLLPIAIPIPIAERAIELLPRLVEVRLEHADVMAEQTHPPGGSVGRSTACRRTGARRSPAARKLARHATRWHTFLDRSFRGGAQALFKGLLEGLGGRVRADRQAASPPNGSSDGDTGHRHQEAWATAEGCGRCICAGGDDSDEHDGRCRGGFETRPVAVADAETAVGEAT
jgi:hypothetical protein